MRRAAIIVGWMALTLGAALILVGLSTLPSGGLMFALPYIFLMPGIVLAVVGGALVRVGRHRPDADNLDGTGGPG